MPGTARVSVQVQVLLLVFAYLCAHSSWHIVPMSEWDVPAEAVCVRAPMGVFLQSSFTFWSFSITQGFMENPRRT